MLKNPLIGEWPLDPLYQKAFELWVEFYDRCEAYDETICSHRGPSGFAMPCYKSEMSKSNKFALEQRKVLLQRMDDAKIPYETRYLAEREALEYHEAKWPKGEPYSLI